MIVNIYLLLAIDLQFTDITFAAKRVKIRVFLISDVENYNKKIFYS